MCKTLSLKNSDGEREKKYLNVFKVLRFRSNFRSLWKVMSLKWLFTYFKSATCTNQFNFFLFRLVKGCHGVCFQGANQIRRWQVDDTACCRYGFRFSWFFISFDIFPLEILSPFSSKWSSQRKTYTRNFEEKCKHESNWSAYFFIYLKKGFVQNWTIFWANFAECIECRHSIQ